MQGRSKRPRSGLPAEDSSSPAAESLHNPAENSTMCQWQTVVPRQQRHPPPSSKPTGKPAAGHATQISESRFAVLTQDASLDQVTDNTPLKVVLRSHGMYDQLRLVRLLKSGSLKLPDKNPADGSQFSATECNTGTAIPSASTTSAPTLTGQRRTQHWVKLAAGSYKLNVDAGQLPNGRMTIGGVCHDHNGFKLLLQHGYQEIHAETDSKIVVTLVQGSIPHFHPLYSLVDS